MATQQQMKTGAADEIPEDLGDLRMPDIAFQQVPEQPPIQPARFTPKEADAAGYDWGFNCGPGAICGLLGMTPAEVRPFMGDFEQKGHTNPTLMNQTLNRLGVKYRLTYRGDNPHVRELPVRFGLVRVQFGGRWTQQGVPMAARYRHTHWVAMSWLGCKVFDLNATCAGGWLLYGEWANQLLPWLIQETTPKADGTWWITHVLEIDRLQRREQQQG